MREIGGEFWKQHDRVDMANKNNEAYLLSGRTALRFIIDDIQRNRIVRKVLMPAYCCESIILPFIQSGIEVQFYQVNFNGIQYPYDNDADIVLLIDFFGYIIDENTKIGQHEKQAGKIIIYDSTHKIDGNADVEDCADYSFCSYRKWLYCNCAIAIKHNGVFDKTTVPRRNENYTKLRDEAAYKKREYIEGLSSDKEVFLSKFNSAEKILEDDYIGYIGEPITFDINEIVSKRRRNAKYLISELNGISSIRRWRKDVRHNDTPMFVPILLDSSIIIDLRNYLISREIYCPMHWPKSSYHNMSNELFNTELSLVCDQRYDLVDMKRIVCAIKEFFNR